MGAVYKEEEGERESQYYMRTIYVMDITGNEAGGVNGGDIWYHRGTITTMTRGKRTENEVKKKGGYHVYQHFLRHGMTPKMIAGPHVARRRAMCCVPKGDGGLCCANMSIREEREART